MALVKLINQSYLWDDVIWEVGSVLEVDDLVSTYQIACGRMAKAPDDAKRTDKPPMMKVAAKPTPEATGEAIAKALREDKAKEAKEDKAREAKEAKEEKENKGRGHEFSRS